jgi:hypothetical protein
MVQFLTKALTTAENSQADKNKLNTPAPHFLYFLAGNKHSDLKFPSDFPD